MQIRVAETGLYMSNNAIVWRVHQGPYALECKGCILKLGGSRKSQLVADRKDQMLKPCVVDFIKSRGKSTNKSLICVRLKSRYLKIKFSRERVASSSPL